MFKRVIVPLDGSPLAEVALPYAEEMAGKMRSDMTLFSVLEYEESEAYKERYGYMEKLGNTTSYHARKYSDTAENSLKVETTIWNGEPAEAIVKYTRKRDLSLIVMATHGRSGISRWAVGSVADKVVRAAERQPLMLIRAKNDRSDIREKRIMKKCLVTLDGSRRSEAVIAYVSDIALKMDMELTLLQVTPSNGDALQNAKNYLQDECRKLEEEGIPANYEAIVGSVADNIIDIANDCAMDLVAMSTRGQTGPSLWSLGSVAQKILFGGDTPLLLVRA